MSDIRSLLKARRQEARVNHPLAAYSSSGQLRCVVCQTNVKHASAWEGHLGTKAHRMNAVRLRQEVQLGEQESHKEESLAVPAKRKANEGSQEDAVDDGSLKKRQRAESTEAGGGGPSQGSVKQLPANFFSDPSQAPMHVVSDDSDNDETDFRPPADHPPPASTTNAILDEEWMHFQSAVINAPDQREAYDRATVVAEPELVADETGGFPSQLQAHQPQEQQEQNNLKSQNERSKQQEERELIMDRLLEEERAQEEADMRVTVMKTRLEAIRRKRVLFTKPRQVAHAHL